VADVRSELDTQFVVVVDQRPTFSPAAERELAVAMAVTPNFPVLRKWCEATP